MKGPQILNLPPPFSPVPNSHPPKSPETDPILPGPLLSILPARPLHKKAQNECPCFIFCSFRHLIIPPPRTPTLFRSPQARDNMHRITTTASHNKHGKPKTAIPTNQPANGKPKCPVNRECMPSQPPSPPPPAKKPNADPQPTDYIPRFKKKTRTTSWCCLRPPIPSTSHQPRSPDNIFLRPQTPLSTRDNLVIMALEVLSE